MFFLFFFITEDCYFVNCSLYFNYVTGTDIIEGYIYESSFYFTTVEQSLMQKNYVCLFCWVFFLYDFPIFYV